MRNSHIRCSLRFSSFSFSFPACWPVFFWGMEDGSRRRSDPLVSGGFLAALERLGAVLCADFGHRAVSLVPLPALFLVPPVPQLFVVTPAATQSFKLVLVFLGVAADPEPGAAKLN